MSDVFCKVYAPLQEEAQALIKEVKEKAEELHTLMCSYHNTRHTSLAKTKLEESIMWFTKGVVKYSTGDCPPEGL